jgi:hypothetical protein
MEYNTLEEFKAHIRKLDGPRTHKIRNSYGVYDYYKFYRKNKPEGHSYVLTESQYFSIIRKINTLLGKRLLEGKDIEFPYRLGRIELRKKKITFRMEDGKIKNNLPINWNATLELWFEDKESFEKKTLVQATAKTAFKIIYNKSKAVFNNKAFYEFSLNRELARTLVMEAKNNRLDGFMISQY